MTDLLADWKAVSARLRSARRLLLMLDFDGTLAPIVPHPSDARVPAATLATLVALRDCPGVAMAVVSGRGARDVRGLLGLRGIDYFGSHGRERIRPWSETVEADRRGRDAIREVCGRLLAGLSDATGFEIEDKGVAAAAHYRNARPGDRARIERTVLQAVAAVPSLRVSRGKMVLRHHPCRRSRQGLCGSDTAPRDRRPPRVLRRRHHGRERLRGARRRGRHSVCRTVGDPLAGALPGLRPA